MYSPSDTRVITPAHAARLQASGIRLSRVARSAARRRPLDPDGPRSVFVLFVFSRLPARQAVFPLPVYFVSCACGAHACTCMHMYMHMYMYMLHVQVQVQYSAIVLSCKFWWAARPFRGRRRRTGSELPNPNRTKPRLRAQARNQLRDSPHSPGPAPTSSPIPTLSPSPSPSGPSPEPIPTSAGARTLMGSADVNRIKKVH